MACRNRLCTVATTCLLFTAGAPLVAADAPSPSRYATRDAVIDTPKTRPAPLRQIAAETRYWAHLVSLLGGGDRRKLAEAQLRFSLQPAFFRDPLLDPSYDRSRNTVRDGYVKLYRELMRREFVSDVIDQGLRDHWSTRVDALGTRWTVRVDPRLAIGRHGYVGADFSLPKASSPALQNVTFTFRRDYADNEMAVGLRYQQSKYFWELERVSGDPLTGDRTTANLVLRF